MIFHIACTRKALPICGMADEDQDTEKLSYRKWFVALLTFIQGSYLA